MNEIQEIILRWIKWFKLEDWRITTTSISSEQVVYDKEVPPADCYFVGVHIARPLKQALIIHDRPLTEEYIVHELIHVKFESFSEAQVNELCNLLLNTVNIKHENN